MHDIRAIRSDPAAFDLGLKRRGLEPLSAELLALDEARRKTMTVAEGLLAERNAASKAIGAAMAAKDMILAEKLKAQVAENKEKIAALESESQALDSKLQERLAAIPNIPLEEVPFGADEHGNVEYRRHASVPGLAFEPKEHYELGEALGQMDFEVAAKLSGARFVVLQKGLARLERALGQFMLDTHTVEHGYTEVNPPILVKDDAMFGTAQLPKFREDQFFTTTSIQIKYGIILDQISKFEENVALSRDTLKYFEENPDKKAEFQAFLEIFSNKNGLKINDIIDRYLVESVSLMNLRNEKKDIEDKHKSLLSGHWLIPTAEVPLTNLVRESILAEEELPRRFTALTPCFRAEAGSAGRDTRGMLRQHQFNKVELVSITTPEQAGAEHERMVSAAETILKKLGLHFRTMTLCTGDMGFASRKTYDIEVWLPGQKTYREISSCSQCGDFQARRMQARYRAPGDKATRFVHTLNGSGVAVGRCLIAVMENYQNADGSITVPEALLPYMGGVTRIEKA